MTRQPKLKLCKLRDRARGRILPTSMTASKLVVICLLVVAGMGAAVAPDELETSVALMAKVGSCSSPSFSPDGKQVAFVSNLSGLPQVWMVSTEGGWPIQITALEDPVGGVSWSPDGAWLAFSVAPGGGMNGQIYLLRPDGTGMRRITDGGKETNNLGVWSKDGRWLGWSSNRKNARRMAAYAYDLTTAESMLIADLEGVGGITDFSRDRTKAIISRLRSRGSRWCRDPKPFGVGQDLFRGNPVNFRKCRHSITT